MDYMQWIIAATGLAGHYYVARKNALGYWFWIAGNIAMIAQSLDKQLYVLAALFVVYTGIALVAIKHWNRPRYETTTRQNQTPCQCA